MLFDRQVYVEKPRVKATKEPRFTPKGKNPDTLYPLA